MADFEFHSLSLSDGPSFSGFLRWFGGDSMRSFETLTALVPGSSGHAQRIQAMLFDKDEFYPASFSS